MSASLFDIAPALAAYLSILAAVLGACMGSFMNCLAWRLVAGESVLRGRSHCTACGAQLTAIDLIPIVSWFALRGRCRHCKGKISPRYVVVEIVMAAVFFGIALEYGFTVQALAYAVLACILCGVTLVDFKLEFGKTVDGQIVLADEISPDTCRLWDSKTNEKLDKDRFRRDLGGVEDAYAEVMKRLMAHDAQ